MSENKTDEQFEVKSREGKRLLAKVSGILKGIGDPDKRAAAAAVALPLCGLYDQLNGMAYSLYTLRPSRSDDGGMDI
jgi:hypothetical protein